MTKSPQPEMQQAKKKPNQRELRAQRLAQEQQRRRWIYIGVGIAIVLLLGALVYFVTNAPQPQAIQGVQTFGNIPAGQHVEGPIPYAQTPPVGGPHNGVWQNCGIYANAIRSENAVHSLEHGAVWITYRPDLPADQIEQLRNLARGQRYVLLSPFDGVPSPVVASAWAAQLQMESATDARLAQFISQYQQGPFTPERGAPCTGGIGTPQ